MLKKIIGWFKRFDERISERARLARGVAVRCDKCKKVVSGWFGSKENGVKKRICMKCVEEENPNDPFLKGVKDHIRELATGERNDEDYLFVARSDERK
jgi:hypothetical protein